MISIIVNGDKLDGFQKARASRSRENVSGEFSFEATTKQAKLTKSPIKINDEVKVVVDNEAFITGYISKIGQRRSNSNNIYVFSGYDKTKDLVRSSISSSVSFNSPISFLSICKIAISKSGLSVSVKDNSGGVDDFKESDKVDLDIGESVFSFLTKYAKKRQVFLNTDGNGNLVINKGATKKLNAAIQELENDNGFNNIISCSSDFNTDDIYSEIVVRSSLNPTSSLSSAFTEGSVSVEASAKDTESLRPGKLEIPVDSIDQETAIKRAKWEVNIRKARALNANFTVPGHSYNKGIWRENTLVDVKSDPMSINGEFLISSVMFTYDRSSGSKTNMTITSKDSYTLEPAVNKKNKSALMDAFK